MILKDRVLPLPQKPISKKLLTCILTEITPIVILGGRLKLMEEENLQALGQLHQVFFEYYVPGGWVPGYVTMQKPGLVFTIITPLFNRLRNNMEYVIGLYKDADLLV